MFLKSLFSSSPVTSIFTNFSKPSTPESTCEVATPVSFPLITNVFETLHTTVENVVSSPNTVCNQTVETVQNAVEAVVSVPATVVHSAETLVENVTNLVTQNPVTAVTNDIAIMLSGPAVIQEGVGEVLQGVHAVAEGILATTGLQPVFSLIDEPIIHPLLWSPLAALTGVPVDEHPAELTSADGFIEQILTGPTVIQHGLGTVLEGVHGVAEGLLATTGLQPIFSVIDEPIIHPLLWEPLGVITDSPVADHPDSLDVAMGATLSGTIDGLFDNCQVTAFLPEVVDNVFSDCNPIATVTTVVDTLLQHCPIVHCLDVLCPSPVVPS